MKLKAIFFLLLFGCVAFSLQAQQEQHYTQFMFFKSTFNPGYVGSKETPTLSALFRSQWLGVEGAPQTQAISFNAPLMFNRVGLGFNLIHHSIGIQERWTLEGAYAYKIPAGEGMLSLGIQASLRYLGLDYNDDRLIAIQPVSSDGSIPVGYQQKYLPNFGVGVYYHSKKFYAGISAPRLVKNNIDFNDQGNTFGQEVRHFFGMGGALIPLSDDWAIQPQVLFKYAENLPLDAELNLSAVWIEKHILGITYRFGNGSYSGLGESVDFLISFHLLDELMGGFAYDLTLSPLKTGQSGSIEAFVQYSFLSSKGTEIVNPRFF